MVHARLARHGLSALAAMLLVLVGMAGAVLAQERWTGTWSVGDTAMRIVQQDRRVFGDFGAAGFFEGNASADGRVLRAIIQLDPATYRFMELDMRGSGDAFIGYRADWGAPDTALPLWEGVTMVGIRTSNARPALSVARENEINEPGRLRRPLFRPIAEWLDFARPAFTLQQLAEAGSAEAAAVETDPVVTAEAAPGLWHGTWSIGVADFVLNQTGDLVVGRNYVPGSVTTLLGQVSPNGRTLRALLETSVVVPNAPLPSREYVELLMGGDNFSFVGDRGEDPSSLSGFFDGSKSGEDGDIEGWTPPATWKQALDAQTLAWITFADASAPAPARQTGLAGRWQIETVGTDLAALFGNAVLNLAPPDGSGTVIGEITATGKASVRLYGAMPSGSEFRGMFMVTDRSGNNPNGQWGTIRLLSNSGSGQISGSWAFSYRAPIASSAPGFTGGQISGRLDGEAANLAFSPNAVGANRSHLVRTLEMPLFSPAKPDGAVWDALQAWWQGSGDLCAAQCSGPIPTRLVLNANDIRHRRGAGSREIRYSDIYGYLRTIVLFGANGNFTRAEETPHWADLWRASESDAASVASRGSGLFLTAPASGELPGSACSTLDQASPIAAGRSAVTVNLPPGFFLVPGNEIAVNLEGSLALSRSIRSDNVIGTERGRIDPLYSAKGGFDDNRNRMGLPPLSEDEMRCGWDRLLLSKGGDSFQMSVWARLEP